jgi:hypothetical protein
MPWVAVVWLAAHELVFQSSLNPDKRNSELKLILNDSQWIHSSTDTAPIQLFFESDEEKLQIAAEYRNTRLDKILSKRFAWI